MFLPTRHLDNTRAGGGGTLIVSPRRTTSENALSLQQTSGSKVSPKSSHDRGQVFVTGRCACPCYGRTLGPSVSTESTAPAKKEKRSKKERKATTTTEFTLSINFGLVNTYKGLGERGVVSRQKSLSPRELGGSTIDACARKLRPFGATPFLRGNCRPRNDANIPSRGSGPIAATACQSGTIIQCMGGNS